ncbi:hypothetical protein FACI_IFERC00001G1705 [Ferroplasma acidarmanus Fer1]|uniref:Uncharacterized protein n=1 Tax=Ferroplasma acidarmanus Fer1 TaxID=333146 RepID=S0ATV9_FERAC|nr:hypothetical protein FACI_IFERC00001G1705 [Ferroplasma acidarmanus Fer1]
MLLNLYNIKEITTEILLNSKIIKILIIFWISANINHGKRIHRFSLFPANYISEYS